MARYGMDYIGQRGGRADVPDYASYGYRGYTTGRGYRTEGGRGTERGYGGERGYGYERGPRFGTRGNVGRGANYWGRGATGGYNWDYSRGGRETRYGAEPGTYGWTGREGGYRVSGQDVRGGYDRDFTDRLRSGWNRVKREARDFIGRGGERERGYGGYGRSYRGY